jgi:hypothetical protein
MVLQNKAMREDENDENQWGEVDSKKDNLNKNIPVRCVVP